MSQKNRIYKHIGVQYESYLVNNIVQHVHVLVLKRPYGNLITLDY